MKVAVIIDDKSTSDVVRARHGLSLLFEKEGFTILFDMGPDEESLKENMRVLGIDASRIDVAVISHPHSDHYGGFKHLSWENPYIKVYIPYGTMDSLGRMLRSHDMIPVEVTKTTQLARDILVAGPFYGPLVEQYLVFNMGDELLIATGCLHPGVETLEKVASSLGRRIGVLMGGLHLRNAPEEVVKRTLDYVVSELGVAKLVPLHCTGRRALEYLREKYGNVLVEAGAGSVIEF
ncbi:MBL fold metallo-hydrolase [Thermosphaera chiliense]|uniref:MBL fold metallo-hydrolase n=1 Tax=Thermosphaera chiliense TaxID=3402707 RepID=A0A7M1UTB1_9CREN|nr:MBL fold metallo-hydrolase [Thermosphaera aggregans]QOR94382.1 MBL fold metallo-hydrolase [Thermosphaera aggregans]